MSNDRHFLLIVFILIISGSILSCSDDSDDSIPLPEFANVVNSGIGSVGGLGQTAAWGDFNNDGCLDLFVANTDSGSPNVFLFKNNCDGTFLDVAVESGLIDVAVRSVSWADFDNDGLLDLVVSTIMAGAPPILYINLDGNFFLDVSTEAGLTVMVGVINHTLWADYDLDGDVDLFQANDGVSLLYQNQGDGKFLEVSLASGLGEFFRSNSAVWFDFNNDGFPDLFLANDGSNKFYLNDGDGSFSDITGQTGLSGDPDWCSISACVGDYNNDGFLDLYVGNIGSSRNSLYRNNGDETFTDVTLETGTEDVGDGRTCAWVDFDADGLLDLLSTNHLSPTRFFRNLGNENFIDVAEEVNMELPIDAFAASWGDPNNDGFMDVFLVGHIGSGFKENGGTPNNNLIIKLVGDGISSNISAIGARVEVLTSKQSQIREVSGGKGCCEQDMLPVHFGVGNETEVDIQVDWTSGDVCLFADIDVEGGRILSISQNDCEIVIF